MFLEKESWQGFYNQAEASDDPNKQLCDWHYINIVAEFVQRATNPMHVILVCDYAIGTITGTITGMVLKPNIQFSQNRDLSLLDV